MFIAIVHIRLSINEKILEINSFDYGVYYIITAMGLLIDMA